MISTVGHALWQHGGVIFLSLLFFLLEFQFSGRRAAAISVIQGACLGMMLACRPSACMIVAVTTAWIAWQSRRRSLLLMLGIAAGYVPWAILYECLYGMALGPTQSQMGASNWGLSGNSLLSVLASPSCGLFVYQPWLLIVALSPFVRNANTPLPRTSAAFPPAWGAYCAVLIVLQVLLVANWRCWWGGDCWGSRLLADVVPLALLYCGMQPMELPDAAALGNRLSHCGGAHVDLHSFVCISRPTDFQKPCATSHRLGDGSVRRRHVACSIMQFIPLRGAKGDNARSVGYTEPLLFAFWRERINGPDR